MEDEEKKFKMKKPLIKNKQKKNTLKKPGDTTHKKQAEEQHSDQKKQAEEEHSEKATRGEHSDKTNRVRKPFRQSRFLIKINGSTR